MLRILVWLFLFIAVWWWLRRLLAPPRPPARGARPGGRQRTLEAPEAMIDCARCGLHLPASEALQDAAGRPYCCAEHRDAGPRSRA